MKKACTIIARPLDLRTESVKPMDEFFLFAQEIDDDNPLAHTTHTCPMTGEDCFPDCAFAVLPAFPREESKDGWVCGKVVEMIGDADYVPQVISWRY